MQSAGWWIGVWLGRHLGIADVSNTLELWKRSADMFVPYCYWRGGARRGATAAAAAVGPGGGGGRGGSPAEGPRGAGGGDRLGSGHPQKTIQSPDRLYKAPPDYTKPQKHYTKTKNIRRRPKILDKTLKY